MLTLQVSDVRDVIGITHNEVTIIGILVGIVIVLGYVVYYVDKKRLEARRDLKELYEKRVNDEKENAKELRDIIREQAKDLNRMFNILENLKESINVNRNR